MKIPLAVIFLLLFSSIYFPTMNSGLTEPFFGFVLMLAVYLTFEESFFLSAMLVSFLPYVRSEGYLILPFFFIVLIYRRKIFMFPFLAFGTIAFSIIGYFYYHDLFWIKNQNPYTGQNSDLYGHGELLHFVNNYDEIFGKPLTLVLLCGIVYFFYRLFFLKSQNTAREKNFFAEESFLIYGSFVIVFVAHSVFWWKGIAGSLGLIRVMAGIIPVAALVGLRGLNFIFSPFKKSKVKLIAVCAFMAIVICVPFRQYYFPYRIEGEQMVIKKAGEWIKNSKYKTQRIYYLHPFLGHVLSLDVFDTNRVVELWSLYPAIKKWGITTVPEKSLIVWDAHYGANEARIPLDTIMNDTNFSLLKVFKPKEEFTVLGGNKFAVYVFSRERIHKTKKTYVEFFDMEQRGELDNENTLTQEKSSSGKFSSKLSERNEFSATVNKKLNYADLQEIKIQLKIFSPQKLSDVFFVMEINNPAGNNLSWERKEIKMDASRENEWNLFETKFIPSADLVSPENSIKLYVWNKSKKTFFVDDFKIEFQ
ncbi:MAG: hypothetical protein HY063_02060 [Bacteroidetes bacterium]|nr:hypothetical protein [Bacteroidota bacterium]